jgi:hypothetical protein
MNTLQNNITIRELESELIKKGLSLKRFYDELLDLQTKFKTSKNEHMYTVTCKFLFAIEKYKNHLTSVACSQASYLMDYSYQV